MKIKSDKLLRRTMLLWFFFVLGIVVAIKLVLEIKTVMGWLGYLLAIISPFFIGFIVAFILNIPASLVQRALAKSSSGFLRRRKKILSVVLIYLLLILLIVLVLRIVVPAIASSAANFINNFSVYYAGVQSIIDFINELPLLDVHITMNSILDALRDYSLDNLSDNLTASIDALSGVFSAVFTTFLALVSSIYILLEKDKFKSFAGRALAAMTSEPLYRGICKYLNALNTNCRQYIYCQTIDGVILGTMATLELALIIRSPYFLVLGVMLGIVNYIPYFGSIIGSLVAVAVVGFTQGFPMAVLAAVVLLITQQIDGNILQPRLMGSSFALSPLLVIISITFGGSLAGPLGMMAAIPIVAVLKDMLDDLILYLERRKGGADTGEAVLHGKQAAGEA